MKWYTYKFTTLKRFEFALTRDESRGKSHWHLELAFWDRGLVVYF